MFLCFLEHLDLCHTLLNIVLLGHVHLQVLSAPQHHIQQHSHDQVQHALFTVKFGLAGAVEGDSGLAGLLLDPEGNDVDRVIALALGDVNLGQLAGQVPLGQYAGGLGILGPHVAVGAADRSIASVGCQSALPLGQAEVANEDLAVCGVVVVQHVLQLQVAVNYPILVYAAQSSCLRSAAVMSSLVSLLDQPVKNLSSLGQLHDQTHAGHTTRHTLDTSSLKTALRCTMCG